MSVVFSFCKLTSVLRPGERDLYLGKILQWPVHVLLLHLGGEDGEHGEDDEDMVRMRRRRMSMFSSSILVVGMVRIRMRTRRRRTGRVGMRRVRMARIRMVRNQLTSQRGK